MRISTALCLLCLAAAALAQGPVTIGGVTYDSVDPGEAFTPAPLPVQDWQPPAPTAAETAAGALVYVAPDAGEYRPHRLPKPAEHVAELTALLTPGEDEPVAFGVYALADLQGLTVTVDLRGAPVTVDVRHAHCWPQRTGWRSRQWYITPELLLPCAAGMKTVPATRGVLREAPFDLPAQTTVGLWLSLTAPTDAPPGAYRATVTLSTGGKAKLEIPLEIEVLPFTLQRPPDRSWVLYADAGRWGGMSEAQTLAELRDYARHGMNGLIEIPLGAPDLSRLKEGKVTYDASAYRRYAQLCLQAGMAGPHVIGSPGAVAVRDVVAPGTDLGQGEWPQAVKDGVAAVAKAAMEATRDIPAPWYYYGVDEPAGDNTYAIQDYESWHAGGARTYATFYVISFLEKASAFLTAPCFVTGLISAEKTATEAREACDRTGAEFWWYGTGSYVNPFPQEGFVWHNRYGAGLLFWKTGAKVEATWTFCRPHEDVFNDFDGSLVNGAEPKEQATAYPHLLKPDDYSTYQGAIPTLAWEGLREGVDDYKYLYTLRQVLAQAKASPQEAVRRAATETEEEVNTLLEAVPWANPMGPNGFPTSRLQQLRRLVATRITLLQAALEGRAYKPPPRQTYPLTFEVRTTAAEATVPLPSIQVVTPSHALVVDGDLGDACWQEAQVASDFHDTFTGQAVQVQTTARILADDRALYVAFDCREPAMAAVKAPETRHDGNTWLEDSVEFFVAGPQRRPYAHLIVTTTGVVLDELNQDAAAWDPELAVGARKGAEGWSVELAVPWEDLRAVGIERSTVMAVNFGRNRHTAQEAPTASAWAVTYGGFHTPQRFGLALLPEGPVVLTALRLPAGWGAQTLVATLGNTTGEPLTARFGVRGAGARTVSLRPGATAAVALPINLRRPGQRALRLSWGPEGGSIQALTVPVTIPEPAEMVANGGLVTAGEVLPVQVRLALSRSDQYDHWLVVHTTGPGVAGATKMQAMASNAARIGVRAAGKVGLSVALVDGGGRAIWHGPAQSFAVLPE